MKKWMIYGANGYTGELIARQAVAQGMQPILAGRSGHKVQALAQELGLPSRVFDLSEVQAIVANLADLEVVLLTAGPFSKTSAAMVAACIQARVHYLDITGEIDVFEHISRQDALAKAAGVVLCPGVGFDVIPTDCVAAALKASLPDAVELHLGFETTVRLSPGTLKSALASAPERGRVRRDAQLQRIGLGTVVRRIDFGRGQRLATAVPWGDVSTAYFTTGIPNVTVYIPTSRLGLMGMRVADLLAPTLRWPWLQAAMGLIIDRFVRGPDEHARMGMPCYVWGEAVNAQGLRRTARVKTVNGYSLTVPGSLRAVDHLLHATLTPGFATPARLMGHDLISKIAGGGPIELS